MQNLTRVVKSIGIAMCISIAIPAFADPAPVYDADSMQQDENFGSDQSQDLPPPPPPPGQEGAFVPSQPSQQAQDSQVQDSSPAPNQPSPQAQYSSPAPSQLAQQAQDSPAVPNQMLAQDSSDAPSMSIEQRMRRVEQQINNM